MSNSHRKVLRTVALTLAYAATVGSSCSSPSATPTGPASPANAYSGRWRHAYVDGTSFDLGAFSVKDSSSGTFSVGPIQAQPGVWMTASGIIYSSGIVYAALTETGGIYGREGEEWDFEGVCSTAVDCSMTWFYPGRSDLTRTIDFQR